MNEYSESMLLYYKRFAYDINVVDNQYHKSCLIWLVHNPMCSFYALQMKIDIW